MISVYATYESSATGMGLMGGTRKRGPKRSAATLFLGLKEAIAARLAAGEKMTAVYQRYGAELQISYAQFTRYVNQHIRNKGSTRRKPHAQPPVAAAYSPLGGGTGAAVKRDGPITPQPREPRQFVFDPTAVHRKKLV
jgi:hypothetical protein